MMRRIKENHARLRISQRTISGDFEKLRKAVGEGRFLFLARQTCTRSLCRATIDSEEVYFILNRRRGTIVTVLTKAQAGGWMLDNGKALGQGEGDQEGFQD